jgi:cysteine-rich repeat protein
MRTSLALPLAFALCAWLAPNPSVAATFVVAPSGGDFTTIQAALAIAQAGDTVDVRTGIYHERVSFPRSGSIGSGFITLQAAAGHAPVVDGTGVPGSHLVLIENRSWIRVIGLELRNNLGVNDGSGIRVLGSGDRIELRNNHIHTIHGTSAMGITVYGTAAVPLSNLVIDGNQIDDCEAAPSEGLTLNGNVTDFAITNNDVHDINNIAIDAIGGETDIQPDPAKVARNGVISGNVVARARSVYGGGFGAGIYVDGGRDIVIEHNTVTQSDLGMEIGAENSGIVTRGIVVRNNILHGNDKAGLVFGGFAAGVGRTRQCEFRNNVLFRNNTLGTGFGEVWIQYAEENTFRNNIVWAGSANRLLTSDAGNLDNVLDYNLWHTDGNALTAQFAWNGALHLGFAAYRAATNQDAQSSFTDPRLVAPGSGNFHHQPTAPGINAGDPATVIAGGETDVDGAPRLSGPRIDIGVDELTCGDLIVHPGEECDDGNPISGDGCDLNCTLTRCGNGIVTTGEQCDDTNVTAGDCCSPTCQFELPGAPCDDRNACSRLDQCTLGTCAGTLAPEPVCRSAGSTQLLIKNSAPDSRDALTWKWQRGDATLLADLGDPLNTTDYTLCIYDRSAGNPQLAWRATMPSAGTCNGRPCWKATGTTGFKYSDRELTPDGVKSLQLKTGANGTASILLKAKGDRLQPSLPLAQDPSVTVQLRNGLGVCWASTLAAPATRNDAAQFSDR